jgi:hypothetical protein
MTWNPAPKIHLTGTAALTRSTGGFATERYGGLADYSLNHRTTLYVQYTRIDFAAAGGEDTETTQIGIRTGF